jgi:hypothetical protein
MYTDVKKRRARSLIYLLNLISGSLTPHHPANSRLPDYLLISRNELIAAGYCTIGGYIETLYYSIQSPDTDLAVRLGGGGGRK